jgi:hypothetical protein
MTVRARVPLEHTVRVHSRWLSPGGAALTLLLGSCSVPGGSGALVRETPSASTAEPLPSSMKGYDLYVWSAADALWFTLITGTNREKTVAEIMPTTQTSVSVQEGPWVRITGSGSEELRRVLARVPKETSVVWSALPGLPACSESCRASVADALRSTGHSPPGYHP